MIKSIYSEKGKFLRNENRTPRHNEDLCENCANCLHCVANTVCEIDDVGHEYPHEWVEFEQDTDFRAHRNERRKDKGWND